MSFTPQPTSSDTTQRVIAALLACCLVLGGAVYKQTGELGASIDGLKAEVTKLQATEAGNSVEVAELKRRVTKLEAKHDR